MNKGQKALGVTDNVITKMLRICSVILLIGSCYMFFDVYFLNKGASSEVVAERYKPEITVSDEGKRIVDMTELKQINPDIKGWLTMDDTGIDYPVLQGDDDYEYLNRDMYGNSCLTGSLYFRSIDTTENADADYRMIYGHHMDASSMFGCLDKYIDAEYFSNHKTGTLITDHGIWDLEAIAVLYTHAYNNTFYYGRSFPCIVRGLETKHIQTISGDLSEADAPILILSTCYEIKPNGRLLVVLKMTPAEDVVVDSGSATDEDISIKDLRMGQIQEGVEPTWSVMNIVFVFITVLCSITMTVDAALRKQLKQVDGFVWALITPLSIVLFFVGQKLSGRGTFVDKYTIVFAGIAIAAAALAAYTVKRKGKAI